MSDNVVHEEEMDGLTLKIYPDEDVENPREWNNLGHMICFHRRYDSLGDKHSTSVKEAQALEVRPDVLSLPLYLYDHSGLRMKVGSFQGLLPQGHAEFDSGKVGIIYVTFEEIRKEYNVKRVTKAVLAKAEKLLRNEVETYDMYLTGDVYYVTVEDANGDVVDSCGGYYGLDYAIGEGQVMLAEAIAGIPEREEARLEAEGRVLQAATC